MPFFNIIPRNTYHKNGTQWIGKFVTRLIGEKNYEFIRIEKRIAYAKFWYTKQTILLKFNQQWPNVSTWFGILNKADTSIGLPAKRAYERHSDFAVFNVNHEGWFQLYFFSAAAIVLIWNWWILAFHYDIRGYFKSK
jgi:hypothetical protein